MPNENLVIGFMFGLIGGTIFTSLLLALGAPPAFNFVDKPVDKPVDGGACYVQVFNFSR